MYMYAYRHSKQLRALRIQGGEGEGWGGGGGTLLRILSSLLQQVLPLCIHCVDVGLYLVGHVVIGVR